MIRNLFQLRLVFSWLITLSGFSYLPAIAQPLNQKVQFTRQDSLRGSITPERNWWNVLHYDITVEPDIEKEAITGTNILKFKTTGSGNRMQIDLQQPMNITGVLFGEEKLPFTREGNVYFLRFPATLPEGKIYSISIQFSGRPLKAKNPPWDGGWIWKKDKNGNPWISVACQGLGASVWFPNKDHQSDEPDEGARLTIITPSHLKGIGNGRLKEEKSLSGGRTSFTWEVTNPINNYNIIPYIGNYISWSDSFNGEKGPLECSYYVLDYNEAAAKKQLKQTDSMLTAFEYWFGPYPFYEDGFKIVESPHLGMEHQSAIAYGNNFSNGYLGRDLSGSGWGLKFDFILIHEAGHEWFGNNITSNDIADMWVHEGFTNYSESLYLDYFFGKEASGSYVRGIRRSIRNDKPIIGHFGVNQEGSGDMYNKTGNLIHMIRRIINDDEKFRSILRGLNKEFYHKSVNGTDIINYFNLQSGTDLTQVFNQYLKTTKIPVLEYQINGPTIKYRWTNCLEEFDMPVIAYAGKEIQLFPTTEWKTETIQGADLTGFRVDADFYISTKRVASGK